MTGRERLVEPEEVSADFARTWWKSLMANTTALVEDAAVLAENSSPGRAQALLVLAMEELAKARWIYDAAQWEWSAPLGLYGQPPREPLPIVVPDQLTARRLPHLDKLAAAEQFASGLGGFWHADRRVEYYFPNDLDTFEEAARRRNLDKQAGFYVDRVDDTVLTPLAITANGVVDFLVHAAQCVEMHLIEDQTRQQDAPDYSLVDTVQDLHWGVLPYAHPDDFAAFVARISGHRDRSEPDSDG
ncbi:AbiV family abortive infection protein [Nocardioides sp. dk4132]|uniref:AbiV family abortive infection protein n=1 Tax=unclassified Nocardioides TaxID=2615069 RepID=UPI0012956AAF|nr:MULTISPECIES: AbiV family abortive infection protein [unclassified Nocardioides]MQW78198.1 AbiV family abortive infection protein [Nocardioides sp. dk4132]QGA07935.1 AbiV family abortive infection protein [Nocardioides sp. dk884]